MDKPTEKEMLKFMQGVRRYVKEIVGDKKPKEMYFRVMEIIDEICKRIQQRDKLEMIDKLIKANLELRRQVGLWE